MLLRSPFRVLFLVGLALVLAGASQAADYRVVSVQNGATVTGRVFFEDDFPPAERVQPDRDPDVCGIRVPTETFVVDEGTKGLANVIVTIEGVQAGKAFSADDVRKLGQLECRYQPHVVVARPGEELRITNQDAILHNVHAYRGDETLFNVAQPFQGQESPHKLEEPGLVRVACDVHSWMQAWVLVLDHPYFAVTDSEGRFTLTGVPPGEHTVQMWHEALGTSSKPVSVAPNGTSEVEFSIGG